MQAMSDLAKKAEDQVSELIDVIEEQDAQVWAYLIGGVVALLVGLIAAYFYAQTIKQKRKSRLERIKETLRGGISL
jgi:H+/gluconate symporter-like permease